MKARIAFVCLAVGFATPACSGQAPDEVAALIQSKLACPARDSADGLVLTAESDHNGKSLSRAVLIIDRAHRRMRSSTRLWAAATPESVTVRGYAYADGRAYACAAENATTCTLAELPAPSPANARRDITFQYMSFRDFLLPAYGGADLSLTGKPNDFEGAAWNLKVTPEGGLPIIMHASAEGVMLATDMLYPDGSFVRTAYTGRAAFEGCDTASSIRQTTHPGDAGYVQQTVISIETKAVMSPADTPVDAPVSAP